MVFESLSGKLSSVFKKLRSKGKLTENDVKVAMREIKLALLEADVNYKVVKRFVDRLTERSIGSVVLDSLTPGQQVIKIVDEELTSLMGSEGSVIHFPSKPPLSALLQVVLPGAPGSPGPVPARCSVRVSPDDGQ